MAVDQESCKNPDYQNPFQSKDDAVKRLIRLVLRAKQTKNFCFGQKSYCNVLSCRYHCLYAQDEDVQSDEEEYFQRTADCFQLQFKDMINKYQSLLMKDSVVSVLLLCLHYFFTASEERCD